MWTVVRILRLLRWPLDVPRDLERRGQLEVDAVGVVDRHDGDAEPGQFLDLTVDDAPVVQGLPYAFQHGARGDREAEVVQADPFRREPVARRGHRTQAEYQGAGTQH